MDQTYPHIPVLKEEVLVAFAPSSLHFFIDGTIGAGGHAEALLQAHPEIELFLGIDQDPEALKISCERLKHWKDKLILRHGNFAQFPLFLKELRWKTVDGILVDLGVSSMQLDSRQRGFSFSSDAPLDMRMNPEDTVQAADLLNTLSERELGRIFREYGEEKRWRQASNAIVTARQQRPILTTGELVSILKPILPWNPKKEINPLTLIFQALRIAVNHELESLEKFVPLAIDDLSVKGRLAVISFHSLEDRIVKNQMRLAASDKWDTCGIEGLFQDKIPTVKLLTRKPIIPTEAEIKKNPRSRSAKLRVVEKLES